MQIFQKRSENRNKVVIPPQEEKNKFETKMLLLKHDREQYGTFPLFELKLLLNIDISS